MTHEQRIAEIREREQKATAEPWTEHFYNVPGHPVYALEAGGEEGDGGEIAQFWGSDNPEEGPAQANLDFTAHARSDIPFLLTLAAECLRLREDGERFISALDLVEYGEDGKIVWEHFRAVIDDFKISQALDAAKEGK